MDVVLVPLLGVIGYALQLYVWAIIIYVIMTWLVQFNVINTSNRFVYMVGDFLHRLTEPTLRPIRRFMPNLGGIDISPILLILLIMLIQNILAGLQVKIATGF